MMLEYNTKIGTDIQAAIALLRAGKLVALPTETVYGLAANALDEAAVLAIFEAKQRPHFDPLICHVQSVSVIDEWVSDTNAVGRLDFELTAAHLASMAVLPNA
jgi:tRNA A37 threonylcarbamoyladenosine synthetase subunit TsaC/SUA5/YrdC